ncbi:MAG TPA: hypothetical protein VF771_13380 [Longimicrobiaceae bacterium]
MPESSTSLADLMDELRRAIEADVAAGFYDDYEVVERAVDCFSDEVDPAELEPVAERLTAAAFEAHARAQATWPAVTDCDRLDAAFAELERRGIVARQNFSCCMNCGTSEIWGEVADAQAEGRVIHGCTFYHEQDTQRAAEGGGVFLAFQASEEGDQAAVRVGREIVDVLRAHGLSPEWTGTADRRIDVPLDWKRRRALD